MRSHIPKSSQPKIDPPKGMTVYPTPEQIEESHRKNPPKPFYRVTLTIGDGFRFAAGVWIFSGFLSLLFIIFWTFVFGRAGFFEGLFR